MIQVSEVTNEYEIPPYSIGGRRTRYPFPTMEIGQSFLITPRADQNWRQVHQKISSIAGSYGSRHGKRFVTRKMDDGIRVWRVE